MRLIPLQSGSAGNCCLVEAGGVRLLFDAGLSPTRVAGRLARHGIDPGSIDAVVISHDHADHVAAAGRLSRRFGLPIHCTDATARAARAALAGADARGFVAGKPIRFASAVGAVTVETLRTPHDAADGVVFVVDDGVHRLGILTDFGHVFRELQATVQTLDAALIESNYDEAMLHDGPYPGFLKNRIAGPGGHISNAESAELVARHGLNLRWACLAHLSATNNRPHLALCAHHAASGGRIPLHVAPRDACGPALAL